MNELCYHRRKIRAAKLAALASDQWGVDIGTTTTCNENTQAELCGDHELLFRLSDWHGPCAIMSVGDVIVRSIEATFLQVGCTK